MFIHFTDSQGNCSEDFVNWRCVNLNHCHYIKPTKRADDRWAIEIVFDNYTLFLVCDDLETANQVWNELNKHLQATHVNQLCDINKLHYVSFQANAD